jgi:hypothetical protein
MPQFYGVAKFRPTAFRHFFMTSTYSMYAFVPEKTPGLVGQNFCLAIQRVFKLNSHRPAGRWLFYLVEFRSGF